MGFQNSKGTLSKLQNNTQNLKDARKVADIFSRETFQIFNVLLKKKKICQHNICVLAPFHLLQIRSHRSSPHCNTSVGAAARL